MCPDWLQELNLKTSSDVPWRDTGIESGASKGDEWIRDGYYLNGTVREPWTITTSTGTLRESWGDYYLRSNGERTTGDYNFNSNAERILDIFY